MILTLKKIKSNPNMLSKESIKIHPHPQMNLHKEQQPQPQSSTFLIMLDMREKLMTREIPLMVMTTVMKPAYL